jgi:S-DNA-T family DNA segregation ATPase FtsK/SpoIIIE
MSKKRTRKRTKQQEPSLANGILAILLTILAILMVLSFFSSAGALGIMLNEYILSGIFGSVRFVSPIIVLVLAWFLIKDVSYHYRPTHGLGAVLFLLSACTAFHMPISPELMWEQALAGQGGGILGMPAWILQTYIGTIGGSVLLFGMLLVSLVLMFNTTLTHIVMVHRSLLLGLGGIGKLLVKSVTALFVPIEGQPQLAEDIKRIGDQEEAFPQDEPLESFADTDDAPVFERTHIEKQPESGEETKEEADISVPEDIAAIPKQPAPKMPHHASKSVWDQKVVIKDIPPVSLLSTKASKPTSGDLQANAKIIKDTLREFRIPVTMGEVRVGPTVTQYTLKPSKGVKLSRITALSNDLALALAAPSIRIEAPIPGKSLVGVEIPNEKTALVSFRELLENEQFRKRKHNMMIALGKDVAGKIWFADLPRMPHLLIAGSTGSGKTICMHTIIASLLYQNTAETLRCIMVDPKRVELSLYNGIPHLLTPVITDTSKTINALKWAVGEMDRRFELLSKAGNRDIISYNEKHPNTKLPYIIFCIDELADLMATAAGDVETGIIRLAQLARAVGIHLIVATQRPSVDVITGLMKANIPGRLSFSVASVTDSRTILDSGGAEKLLGRGDMLYLSPEYSKPIRIQGAFLSEDETKAIVEYLRVDDEDLYDESIIGTQPGANMSLFGGPDDDRDELFDAAKQEVIAAGKASTSHLQRRLKVGYARAARIMDELEEAGIIGPANGSKPRDVLMTATELREEESLAGSPPVFTPPEHAQLDGLTDDDEEDEAELFAEDELDEEEHFDKEAAAIEEDDENNQLVEDLEQDDMIDEEESNELTDNDSEEENDDDKLAPSTTHSFFH